MSTRTKVGDELAWSLNPYIGTAEGIEQTCALLHRHAVTLHHLQEQECNGPAWMDRSDSEIGREYRANGASERHREMMTRHTERMAEWEADVERRSEQLSARITDLVGDLPTPDEGPWTVTIQGDPRGRTVYLTAPDGREITVY